MAQKGQFYVTVDRQGKIKVIVCDSNGLNDGIIIEGFPAEVLEHFELSDDKSGEIVYKTRA